MPTLSLENIHVYTRDAGAEIVRGVTLKLAGPGIHVVMGPNGAGKSSLANAVMGHQDYKLKGRVLLDGEDLTELPTHEKARRGLTLAVQSPPEIEGVRVSEVLLRIAKRSLADTGEALKAVEEALSLVGLPRSMLNRYLMVGMSGGERKRLELARVMLQRPRAAFLDEPDSGVDIESIPLIAKAIRRLEEQGAVVVLITHQPRLLEYLEPRRVYIMHGGKVVAEGGVELVRLVEEKGYTWIARNNGGR